MPADLVRINGCLLGAACGDALGAPFEGYQLVEPQLVEDWAHAPAPLTYTDDTAMMMVVGEHLADVVARGGRSWDVNLLGRFVDEWRREPGRGYGPGMHHLFTMVEAGTPGAEAAQSLHGGAGSMGNGAAMRTAPVGLLGRPLDRIAVLARRVAATTHTHPLGIEGAVVQTLAVALAAIGETRRPVRRREFLNGIRPHVRHPHLAGTVAELADLPAAVTPREVAHRFGNDATAATSVPAALSAFLYAPDDPVTAISYAIEIGGDTDTIATMTGAIAGARSGHAALPPAWIDRLEAGDRLLQIAARLAR